MRHALLVSSLCLHRQLLGVRLLLLARPQRVRRLNRSRLLLLPIGAPRIQRRRKHGAHHTPCRLSKHAHIGLMLQIAVQPRLPALGQTRLHHALHRHLLQVRHAQLLLSLELLQQLRLHRLLGSARMRPKLLLPHALLRLVVVARTLQLAPQRLQLSVALLIAPRLLRVQQLLPLLQHALLLLMPILAPRRQRRRKHGAHHSPCSRRQHAHIGLPLQIQVQPRLPALGEARLHHALRRRLHQMLHARLVSRLRLRRQGLGALLLLGQKLHPKLLRHL